MADSNRVLAQRILPAGGRTAAGWQPFASAGSSSPHYLRCAQASFERVPSLDGFRAVCIVMVMSSHFISAELFPGGLGVLVFFVVSGFLITRLLFAELRAAGRISLANFYLRRFFRLYPVIIVYTAVVILSFVASSHPVNWYEPVSALFYFANYLYAWRSMTEHAHVTGMPFVTFWSLSIEEHFYLFFPLLFLLTRGKRLVAAMIATCVGCLAIRIGIAALRPDWLSSHFFYYSDARLDSIAFGVLLACLCETERFGKLIGIVERPWVVAGALAGILLCTAIRDDWFRETLRYTILGACATIVLAAVVFSPRYRLVQLVLNWPAVRWIGVLSYSIYVWHTLLPLLVRWYMPALPRGVTAPALFALSVAIAALSYYGIERPAGALRHRFGSKTSN